MGGSLLFYTHYTKVTLNWTFSFFFGCYYTEYLNQLALELGIAELVQTTPVTRLSYIYIELLWYFHTKHHLIYHDISWDIYSYHPIFMDFHGFSYGFSWIFMDSHGFSRIFMDFHGFFYGLWSNTQTFHRAARCHRLGRRFGITQLRWPPHVRSSSVSWWPWGMRCLDWSPSVIYIYIYIYCTCMYIWP